MIVSLLLASCSRVPEFNPDCPTFLIETNPTNLDPRFATDSQSQRIDFLLFSSLVARGGQMNLRGDLAESWETPDPLTTASLTPRFSGASRAPLSGSFPPLPPRISPSIPPAPARSVSSAKPKMTKP